MERNTSSNDGLTIRPEKPGTSLLKYVVFKLEDIDSGNLRSARNKFLLITFFAIFSVALISIGKPFIEKYIIPEATFWINSQNHSLLEVFGGLIAIIIGMVLSWEFINSGKRNALFLVFAFLSIGLLDIFHAFSDYCHNQFVWFHSSGAFISSSFFFGSTLIRTGGKNSKDESIALRRFYLFLGAMMIIIFAIVSIQFFQYIPNVLTKTLPHHTPVIEATGHFSTFIHSINFISCILYLCAGVIFVRGFLKTNDVVYLIFGASTLLLFQSEISFTFSKLWDPMWWYWHVIKAIVFSGLLIGLAYGFSRTFYRLHSSRIKLATFIGEIEMKNIELQKAYARIKETQRYLNESEKLASLGRMAASLAHEIKNPLGAITNSLGVLDKYNSLAADDLELVGIVEREIERLNKLVEDFLDFARPSNLDRRQTDINALIDETLSILELDRIVEGITIVKSLDSHMPDLMLDRNHMKQSLLNLFINAIQAMEDGGDLTIKTRFNKVEDEVEITVADTGTGMSEDILSHVFQPFFTTKDTGLGLGLNIVHKIIKEHGGYITITSTEGKGTEMKLNFPVPEPAASKKTFEEIIAKPETQEIND
jgi:signal transduction histidine kinase